LAGRPELQAYWLQVGRSAGTTIVRAGSVSSADRGTIATEREELVMGDPVAPERPGGRDAARQEQAGIPATPVISPSEEAPGYPFPLLDGVSPTLGWQFQPTAKGGPVFVISAPYWARLAQSRRKFPADRSRMDPRLAVPDQAGSCRRPAGAGQAGSPGVRGGEKARLAGA